MPLPQRTGVLKVKSACNFFMRVFVLWQVLIFVQVLVGSVSIPFFILLLASPAQSIVLTVELITLVISISGCLIGFPLPTKCKINAKTFAKSCFQYVKTLLVMAVIFLTSTSYCFVVKEGMSMSSVKGYIASLIPTIPISIFIWMIQEKIRRKRDKRKQTMKQREWRTLLVRKKAESLSTEEEMINFTSLEGSD